MGKTLFEKIWTKHVVRERADGSSLLYIDCHLVHEVTSPQAFEGVRLAGRKIRRPELAFATKDHNVPTTEDRLDIKDPVSRAQVVALKKNCEEAGIKLFGPLITYTFRPTGGVTMPISSILISKIPAQIILMSIDSIIGTIRGSVRSRIPIESINIPSIT